MASGQILKVYGKKSFNTCPICWMPLYIGNGTEAEKWCRVQIAFKNKPAESIKNEYTSERNRPCRAFGTPFGECNCNYAHILHRSSDGEGSARWETIWKKNPDGGKVMKFELYSKEPLKKADFYAITCIENGMFGGMKTDGCDLFELVCARNSGRNYYTHVLKFQQL